MLHQRWLLQIKRKSVNCYNLNIRIHVLLIFIAWLECGALLNCVAISLFYDFFGSRNGNNKGIERMRDVRCYIF